MNFLSAGNRMRVVRSRIHRRIQYELSLRFVKRPVKMRNRVPLISFTFDDFPRSALYTGGAVLKEHGINATYYASLGLAGTVGPTGEIFHHADLPVLLECGHELGCHTFSHCNASLTSPKAFQQSIIENQNALNQLLSGVEFKTHSYPIGSPSLGVKRRSSQRFLGCRGGGQTYNKSQMDLNYLYGYFLEQSFPQAEQIEDVIAENCAACGWLIFATHDVCANPTRFGCVPAFFERIVKFGVKSGSQILPVSKALDIICAGN